MTQSGSSIERRAANGIYYRVEGRGEPLLLLHGMLVSGRMYDPLIDLLRNDFRMIIPDLRGHGLSGDLPGPYDVKALADDLADVMAEANFKRGIVMGYSHGGAVAQQLAATRPDAVSKLMLACTYAHNTTTTREWIEANVFRGLLFFISPATVGRIVMRAAKPKLGRSVVLTDEKAKWVESLFAVNRSRPMRGVVKGLIDFDARPFLKDIHAPTIVVAGAGDDAVPHHHYETLVGGIPGARGVVFDGAGHALIWTHTERLADVLKSMLNPATTSNSGVPPK